MPRAIEKYLLEIDPFIIQKKISKSYSDLIFHLNLLPSEFGAHISH